MLSVFCYTGLSIDTTGSHFVQMIVHAMMTIKRYDNFKRTFDPLPDAKRNRRASDEVSRL